MIFYGAKELEEGFRTVRKNTILVAEDIPADKYGFKITPDVMSVGEMLAHLAVSPGWQQRVHGDRLTTIDFSNFGEVLAMAKAEELSVASSKESILSALKDRGEAFAAFLGGLSEEILAERVSFPLPPNSSKSRFEMLLGAKEHEMHHRAQLMLVERQLGIVPHLTRQRQAFAAQFSAQQAGAAR